MWSGWSFWNHFTSRGCLYVSCNAEFWGNFVRIVPCALSHLVYSWRPRLLSKSCCLCEKENKQHFQLTLCFFLFLLTNELIARYYTLFTNINLLLSAEILFHQNADSKLVLKRLDNIDELFYASWVVVLISGVIYFCLFRKYTPSSFSNVGESCQSSSSSP